MVLLVWVLLLPVKILAVQFFWEVHCRRTGFLIAKTSLSYGLESGLLGGETQGSIIYGIPAIFRLGWHPGFTINEKIDIFILMKTGWAFGIWGSDLEKDAKSNGIVGGFNFGGRYFLTPLVDVYAELGYTYYGLARSSNHPEYPLGYGSGKLYASMGLSFKFGKYQSVRGTSPNRSPVACAPLLQRRSGEGEME